MHPAEETATPPKTQHVIVTTSTRRTSHDLHNLSRIDCMLHKYVLSMLAVQLPLRKRVRIARAVHTTDKKKYVLGA